MALQVKVGTITVPTSGSIPAINVGFQPTLFIFTSAGDDLSWSTGVGTASSSRSSYGASDGVNNCCISHYSFGTLASKVIHNDNCSAVYNDTSLAFSTRVSATDANSFTLTVSKYPGNQQYVHYMAFGGIKAEVGIKNNRVGTVGLEQFNLTDNTLTPDLIGIAGVSTFQTDLNTVLRNNQVCVGWANATDQLFNAVWHTDGLNTHFARRGQGTNRIIQFIINTGDFGTNTVPEAEFASFGTGSFTFNYLSVNSINKSPFLYIAAEGLLTEFGTVLQPTTDGFTNSSLSIKPGALYCQSFATPASVTTDVNATLMHGFTDGTDEIAVLQDVRNGLSASGNFITRGQWQKVIAFSDYNTFYGDGSATFTTNNLRLDWTSTDGTQREVNFIAFGEEASVLRASPLFLGQDF